LGRVIQGPCDVKGWISRTPTASEARPSHCPCCGKASRPLGARRVVWGHGTRERQIWGPPGPGGAPVITAIRVRRYLCTACDATITVVPRGLAAGWRYSGSAVALALALWGCMREVQAVVRRALSPGRICGQSQPQRWRTLRRWVGAVVEGRLFEALRVAPGDSVRAVAERIALSAVGRADPAAAAASLAHRAWAGGSALA
jgi:hypothetical protein